MDVIVGKRWYGCDIIVDMRSKAERIFADAIPKAKAIGWQGWERHSRNVAVIAEKVAGAAGMDADKAYALGLLHDIGKSVSTPDENMTHHLSGYDILMGEGMPEAARIAITHTFYEGQEMEHFWDILAQGGVVERTRELLYAEPFDDYDRLIQLADNMATSEGVTTIAERFCDVLTRHVLPEPGGNIRALYELKEYFDQKCGQNIYQLLREEIEKTIF